VASQSLTIAGASRPLPGEVKNGDRWTVQRDGDRYRIALIDGLGHGPEAAKAASAAVAALEARPDLDAVAALAACQRALGGTRGAVILICQIDLAARALTYAGIGNVEGRLIQRDRSARLISRRGIVGGAPHSVRPLCLDLYHAFVLLLHSDGVSARFETSDLSNWPASDPRRLADEILTGWSRPTDDATVVVATGTLDNPAEPD
jgi:hypothetical protein